MRKVPYSYENEAPAYCWHLYSDLLASSTGPALVLGHWSTGCGEEHQCPIAKQAGVDQKSSEDGHLTWACVVRSVFLEEVMSELGPVG